MLSLFGNELLSIYKVVGYILFLRLFVIGGTWHGILGHRVSLFCLLSLEIICCTDKRGAAFWGVLSSRYCSQDGFNVVSVIQRMNDPSFNM